jgi:hypothetical protein
MKEELVKLADNLDRMGHTNLSNKVDRLLLKLSQSYGYGSTPSRFHPLYPVHWRSTSDWAAVWPSSIREHYYDLAKFPGNEESLNQYLNAFGVLEHQKPKVIKSVKEDTRWMGGVSSEPQSQPTVMPSPKVKKPVGSVTSDHKLALFVADKNDNIPYKMSPNTFKNIMGNPDLELQDLEDADLKVLFPTLY